MLRDFVGSMGNLPWYIQYTILRLDEMKDKPQVRLVVNRIQDRIVG